MLCPGTSSPFSSMTGISDEGRRIVERRHHVGESFRGAGREFSWVGAQAQRWRGRGDLPLSRLCRSAVLVTWHQKLERCPQARSTFIHRPLRARRGRQLFLYMFLEAQWSGWFPLDNSSCAVVVWVRKQVTRNAVCTT